MCLYYTTMILILHENKSEGSGGPVKVLPPPGPYLATGTIAPSASTGVTT